MASKEIRLEVNAAKTMYMVMSRDQNVGRSYNINLSSVQLMHNQFVLKY